MGSRTSNWPPSSGSTGSITAGSAAPSATCHPPRTKPVSIVSPSRPPPGLNERSLGFPLEVRPNPELLQVRVPVRRVTDPGEACPSPVGRLRRPQTSRPHPYGGTANTEGPRIARTTGIVGVRRSLYGRLYGSALRAVLGHSRACAARARFADAGHPGTRHPVCVARCPPCRRKRKAIDGVRATWSSAPDARHCDVPQISPRERVASSSIASASCHASSRVRD